MFDTPDILRLRVLLCFLKLSDEDCTVTGISRTLNVEKYKISRTLISLEKDGYIDCEDIRNPILTPTGYQEARRYSDRIDITLNHLLYEGVDIENARRDAFYWALYCSDKTMDAVRATEQHYRVKYELRDFKQFSGIALCKKFHDGCYHFPFRIYREHVKNGNNLSMANEGFEHPCTLCIENGIGIIQLLAQSIAAKSKLNGKLMRGKVNSLKYFNFGRYISAEINGNVLSFPAESLHFVNMGTGVGQILHGSVCLKMECSAGVLHMPESTAIFTILI